MKAILERLGIIILYVSLSFTLGAIFWLIVPWLGVLVGLSAFALFFLGSCFAVSGRISQQEEDAGLGRRS